jgi:hypothetical protein
MQKPSGQVACTGDVAVFNIVCMQEPSSQVACAGDVAISKCLYLYRNLQEKKLCTYTGPFRKKNSVPIQEPSGKKTLYLYRNLQEKKLCT